MDDFSDDGFDDFDDSVLQQIEENAIQFTQAQKFAQSQAPPVAAAAKPSAYEYGLEDDDDLDDTDVVDARDLEAAKAGGAGGLTAQPQRLAQQWNTQFHRPPVPPQPGPLQQRPAYPPRTQFPQPQRSQYPPHVPSPHFRPGAIPQRPAPQPSQFARPPPPVSRPYPAPPSQAPRGTLAPAHGPPGQVNIVAALQDRLSALETELTAAKGEAAILRSKYEKSNVAHDEEVARLKKQNAENAVKHERAIEAALAAERTAATELQFARQDLREGLGRAKSRKKDGGSTTPKKTKSWGMADGFDGVEMTASPSKLQAQKRKETAQTVVAQGERTPSKGKRKRPAVDSPTFALETHSGDLQAVAEGLRPPQIQSAFGPRPYVGQSDLSLDFLKLALDHSIDHGQPLTFDLFSQFSFPSNPPKSFATLIFEKLPTMGNSHDPCSLLVDFADLLIDMWQQCLSERYHFPIYYLGALLSFTLHLQNGSVAPRIISSLIPICTTTCRLVALPRFNSPHGDISGHPDNLIRQLSVDLTIPQTMSLLNLAAVGCLSPPVADEDEEDSPRKTSPQVEFWRTVDMEFVILMLSVKQPEQWWFPMISLLSTSVLPTSLGPVPSPISSTTYENNPGTPEIIAEAIINRVSMCMVDLPRWAPPGSAIEVQVRLAVLDSLIVFATSPFCFLQIAQSDITIQRLVTTLCWAIDQLYDVDTSFPEPGKGPPTCSASRSGISGNGTELDDHDLAGVTFMEIDKKYAEQQQVEEDFQKMQLEGTIDIEEDSEESRRQSTPALLCRVISKAVLLLHALVTDERTANIVDMTRQLATSAGGSQRYLLTLARLSFAEEELVLEAGIDVETAERAHALLEMAVTPDEGEEMGALFEAD